MAADNREWYRDWWNKKTGYVERAKFRISEGEHKRQKDRAAWRRNFLVVGAVAGGIAIIAIAKRASRR